MSEIDIRDFLRFAFKQYDLTVLSEIDQHFHLEGNYVVEIESARLVKLLHNGQVIAPFDDVEELCTQILH